MAAISCTPRALTGLLLVACTALSGCSRVGEAELRAHLAQWFALGETMGFAARQDCAAGAFRLVDTQVGSGLPVVSSVPRAIAVLNTRGAVALNRTDEAPDAGMVALTNTDRTLGYKMRGVSLEARACMDEQTESAFRYALVNPHAMLAYDSRLAAVMLLDPDTRVLIVAMGAG